MNSPVVRRFHFDPTTPFGAALRTVKAALDDEGLEILPNPGRQPYSAHVDGQMVVVVPAAAIVEKQGAH